MKKLDEIMELMTDEMDEFKKGLLHLQKLSNELQNRSIPITTEALDKQLNFFFQKQEKRDGLTAEELRAIDQKLKKAYILPKSLGVILGSSLILLITLIGYLSFEIIALKNKEIEERLTRSYSTYLQENPEQKKAYESWLHNQNNP